MAIDGLAQRRIELLARAECLAFNHNGRNTMFGRKDKTGGIRTVADDGGNAAWPLLLTLRTDDSLHVAAAPGYQDDDIFHGAHCTVRAMKNDAAGAKPAADMGVLVEQRY